MRQGLMLRLTVLVVVTLSLQVLLQVDAASADPSTLDGGDEFRGMFVLKLPFGEGRAFSTPRVGFEVNVQERSDLDTLKVSHDPNTGQRLPEIDLGPIRTWSIDELEFSLPQGQRENKGRPGRFRTTG